MSPARRQLPTAARGRAERLDGRLTAARRAMTLAAATCLVSAWGFADGSSTSAMLGLIAAAGVLVGAVLALRRPL